MIINENTIFPSNKMILVRVQDKPTETSSGLIIAGNEANSAPVVGQIIRVGKESVYKANDWVMFRRYSIDQLNFQEGEEEKTVYFLADSDILATISDKVETVKEEKKDKKYSAIEEKKKSNKNEKNRR